ncbi:hypothetical protein O6H91_04G142900 [Diphasiastrum complanatum]|uniref:Uncharacterized protein n=2 Tax=Diphasiastrum complanatum TaxID=34168 RepID=A0ACC2E2G4_DIPCM|nr:hypothetical protein O6H91_04G142900 [Diphasiastrum complanatum]KAJ7560731.1 hypothetical protein O6H91_04G142900 [Diphasiastrum complanatum]
MPRPGPRPYECVRRAWHSDAHQPLRGSLTQEILRVLTELHKPETRRKKEWQEKLPTVVLRAEEILYSKAKSEAEYMDVKTLKDRLEDAVDTMIRRTDASREDPYMQPCVEAALSLGCYPKNFPRGQRPGARQSGITKRVASALSGASSGSSTGGSPSQQNQSSIHVHALQDPRREDKKHFAKASPISLPGENFLSSPRPELPMPGAMNPRLLRPAFCPEPRSVLYTGHHLNSAAINSGSVSKREELCPNTVDFQPRAKASQDSQAVAKLHIPNAVELATRYPSVCRSSHNSTDPACKSLNASPYSSSLHGSHVFQPSAGLTSFTGSLRFETPVFAENNRQMEASVARLVKNARSVALTSYSPSPANSFANPVSGKGRMLPSLLSQVRCATPGDSAESVLKGLWNQPKETSSLTRVQSPAEQSTAASPIPVLDDLQLRLAPPGRFLSSSAISQGFTNSDSCFTHLPLQQSEEAQKFVKPSLEGIQRLPRCSMHTHQSSIWLGP